MKDTIKHDTSQGNTKKNQVLLKKLEELN